MTVCKRLWIIGAVLAGSCTALDNDEKDPLLIFSQTYDFGESDHGWQHGFADYPAGPDSTLYELKYSYTDQPESILTKKSLMLSGNNLNRDLFMFLKKKVTGLKPDTDYTITFKVELAASCNAVGTAGSTFLKAGALRSEPVPVIQSGYHVMNIDKGDEQSAGQDLVSLGDIATASGVSGYSVLAFNNTIANSRYVARSNAQGEIWLIVATDSNVAGTTTLFYGRVNVVFSAS